MVIWEINHNGKTFERLWNIMINLCSSTSYASKHYLEDNLGLQDDQSL